MLFRSFLFFIGYVTAVVPSESIEKLTQLLFSAKISAKFGKKRKKGRKIILTYSAYADLLNVIPEGEITLDEVKRHGVPHIFSLYGRRWGIWIGALLTAIMLVASDEFVWRIEVYGNERVSEKQIEDALSELDFKLGTCVKDVDFDVLHNRFLAASEDIAWISVNMRGNVAYAEVREYLTSELDKKDGAANIIAAKDGIITQVSVFDGKREAVIGESVKKGQLLISGVVEYEGTDTHYVYAKGEVYAECKRAIHIEIPLQREITKKSALKSVCRGVKFFSKEIFFDRKGRIEADLCDTITMYKDVTAFNGTVLPICLVTVKQLATETVHETYTPEEAAAIAYAEYKKEFIEKTDGVTLLSYDVESGLNSDASAYIIDCTLNVIENIAQTKEFAVNE